MLFGSGFLANTGVIAALATDGVVACDALNHASIVDGCRLARAQTLVYPHGEIPDGADVIVTDAVFSMDGDVAPTWTALVETGARVIVDEAHATGVIGREGRGLVHELGSAERRHHRRHARQGARLLRRVRLLRRAHRGRARQPRAHADLLDRAPAAVGRRGAEGARADAGRWSPRLHANARTLRGARASRSATCRSSRSCSATPEAALERARPRWSRASSPRRSARRPCPEGTSRLRLVATAAHDPADLSGGRLYENVMNELGYAVPRREVVPTGDVRQHGR